MDIIQAPPPKLEAFQANMEIPTIAQQTPHESTSLETTDITSPAILIDIRRAMDQVSLLKGYPTLRAFVEQDAYNVRVASSSRPPYRILPQGVVAFKVSRLRGHQELHNICVALYDGRREGVKP